jgi:hypothetical protein
MDASHSDAADHTRGSRGVQHASHAAYAAARSSTPTAGHDRVTLATQVSSTSVAIDCCIVHTWYAVDRSTTYTTAPLSAGRHTITLQVLEMDWTNTDYGPANCKLSTRPTYQWVCAWRRFTTVTVRVPSSSSPASCVVPRLSGLRTEDAKAQIRLAKCSLAPITRKSANRAQGCPRAAARNRGRNFPRHGDQPGREQGPPSG